MDQPTRILSLLFSTGWLCLGAQPPIESNVVYGMYSGLALLMDVHRPANPNGFGVVFISGSGWHAPQTYGARPLKEGQAVTAYALPLAAAGYTVFSINHRAAPRFRYPAAVEDAQRAVRYVRHYAGKYGIDPTRIGAAGGSSGGHLVSMLGTLDGQGDPADPDPVNRQSAKVQCVVARAAPCDLARMEGEFGAATVASFLGMRKDRTDSATSVEYKSYTAASPIRQVSPDDPPFLLIHGDADQTVPFEQSELMERALRQAGVEVRLLRIPGGGHGPTFSPAQSPPDYIAAMIAWFDRHLKSAGSRRQ